MSSRCLVWAFAKCPSRLWMRAVCVKWGTEIKMLNWKASRGFFIIKPTRCTNFTNFILACNSTCFGQFLWPSSGVYSLYTQQWYMSYRSVDSFWAGAYAPARKLSTNLCYNACSHECKKEKKKDSKGVCIYVNIRTVKNVVDVQGGLWWVEGAPWLKLRKPLTLCFVQCLI